MKFETKNISNSVADVDGGTRTVKVVMSEMGSKDHDNDIIHESAYNRTIKARGPQASNMIWHLGDHIPSLKNAVGKPKEIYKQGNQLVFVTSVLKTSFGNDVLEMYDAKTINQHSVGFMTKDSEIVNKGKEDEYRLIKEIMLYEGSSVLWGANENTPTLSVSKSITKEQAEKDFFACSGELVNLHRLFKSGHLTDETFELLELQLAQKTEKLEQLFKVATQFAAKPALDPVNESSLLEVLKTFNNSLIIGNESRRIESAISATRSTA